MEPVNRQAIEAILRFLPHFRVTANEFYVCDPSLHSLIHTRTPEVMEFHDLLYDLAVQSVLDSMAESGQALRAQPRRCGESSCRHASEAVDNARQKGAFFAAGISPP